MRDGCLESVETIVERQYGVLAERNCEGLLFGAEHRRVRCLRPHRGIIDEVALLPLRHRLRVEVVTPGELFDRSLRFLHRRPAGPRARWKGQETPFGPSVLARKPEKCAARRCKPAPWSLTPVVPCKASADDTTWVPSLSSGSSGLEKCAARRCKP